MDKNIYKMFNKEEILVADAVLTIFKKREN
jgi:hypothetical protein